MKAEEKPGAEGEDEGGRGKTRERGEELRQEKPFFRSNLEIVYFDDKSINFGSGRSGFFGGREGEGRRDENLLQI